MESEGLRGACVSRCFVAGVGAAVGVEGRQVGAGGGACVVVFNVVVGLGICCGCFPGFLRVRGVL